MRPSNSKDAKRLGERSTLFGIVVGDQLDFVSAPFHSCQRPPMPFDSESPPQVDQHRLILQLILSAVFGGLIWALSPVLAGRLEPFDNPTYFWVTMIAAGAVGASLYPCNLWPAPLAIYAGQYAYVLLFIPSLRPSLIFGMVIGVFFQLPSILGALAVHMLWRLTKPVESSD